MRKLLVLALLFSIRAAVADELGPSVDKIAKAALDETGVPSATVAVVVDGKVAYAQAYGKARIAPEKAAAPAMRYSIGSISKQFTATAVLLLAEEKKLTLDDPVGKYIPNLTRGNEVTIRQILSHTSGYPDYAPQNYVIPAWLKPVTSEGILDGWARKPLEFEPGTKWQYSNTNFVIAGLIVEKVSGKPLFDFLQERVFKKLGMTTVVNSDQGKLPDADAQGTFRRAFGPVHAAGHEGPGWMYAAGELAMTAEDLAKWDVAIIQGTILSPESWKQLGTETLLKNGAGTRYGLGIEVELFQGHRSLDHDGEVLGFVADNVVLPDDKIAVAVLTNQDASRAAEVISNKVRDLLLRQANAPSAAADAKVKKMLEGLAEKRPDRSLLTDNASSYFSDEAVAEYAKSVAPFGKLVSVEQLNSGRRGGMTHRRYLARYAKKSVMLSVYETDEGKLEEFLITGQQ